MGIRKRKPTSPGRRFQTVSDFSEITKTTPEKSLLRPLRSLLETARCPADVLLAEVPGDVPSRDAVIGAVRA